MTTASLGTNIGSPTPLLGGSAFPPRDRAVVRWLGLVWTLVRTDFKVRYHGSLGGFVWALAKPLAMFVLLMVYCPRVLGQWFDGIRFYAAASSPRRSRRTWAGLR